MESCSTATIDPQAMADSTGERRWSSSVDAGGSSGIGEGIRNEEVLVFCERDDEMHIFSVTTETTLDNVYEKLEEKWVGISDGNTALYYLEPEGGFKVMLRSNVDVMLMSRVHRLVKKGTCKMVACPITPSKKRTRYTNSVSPKKKFPVIHAGTMSRNTFLLELHTENMGVDTENLCAKKI